DLFGDVIGCFQVVAEEPHLAVNVALQQHLSLFIRELTMNRNGGGSANRCEVTLKFTALFEACNRRVKNNEIGGVGGIPVTVTIDLGEAPFLLQFLNQVLVECYLKFGRQVYLSRLDHLHFDRRCRWLYDWRWLRRQQRRRAQSRY